MSYEGSMLTRRQMPEKKAVANAILRSLFRHNGVLKEFGEAEDVVEELANEFGLNHEQRTAQLETVYHKENRIKKSNLWHRLLFRAADVLATRRLVTRPKDTVKLTNHREWMLSELGYDEVLEQLHLPKEEKDDLAVRSYEVQQIVKSIIEKPVPHSYDPIENSKKTVLSSTKESKLRRRGFRQAIVDSYDFRCAFCGLKIHAPSTQRWEVEAAHIVPHHANGKDDIWNGIALCRLHHWTFDVGWLSISDDFHVVLSPLIDSLDRNVGVMHNISLFDRFFTDKTCILLPANPNCFPHPNSLKWHRENIFAR